MSDDQRADFKKASAFSFGRKAKNTFESAPAAFPSEKDIAGKENATKRLPIH